MQRRFLIPFILFLLAFVSANARAAWVLDGTYAGGHEPAYAAAAVTDGAGGAIIVWTELRTVSYDVYAHRLDANGNPAWPGDGVPVCAAASEQTQVVAVSDGAGGVIVAWRDSRTGTEDIYAQRLNSNGAPVWAADGVALCTATGVQAGPVIVTDGAGGAIVCWQDARSGTNWDVYARRINAAGTPQWTANGVAVCTLPSSQTGPTGAEDGSGGIVIAWSDFRSGFGSDIYAQRLNASGTPQWVANGIGVCTAANEQALVVAAADGTGRTLLAWYDERGADKDIFAQRLDAFGMSLWAADGNVVCAASDDQGSPAIVRDGSGGAIVAWEDFRNGVDVNLFAQRMNEFGVAMWEYNGVGVCTASGGQGQVSLLSDGAGGAIATWHDSRSGSGYDVYARRLLEHGHPAWEYEGSPLTTAPGDQSGAFTASDGAGGVIAAWTDTRTSAPRVFAQRAEPRYGYWGRPEPAIKSAVDNPADQGGRVIVRWAASQRDLYYMPAITHYSVWRSSDFATFTAAQCANGEKESGDPRAVALDHSAPAAWEELTPEGPVYWEWIANVGASYLPSYSYTAPTRQDSTITDPATTYFKILAHEIEVPQGRLWESLTVSARSVDNLAPAAPLLLAIRASGTHAVLTWKPVEEPDFAHYTLYRAGTNGVRVLVDNFLIDATLPNHTDVGAAAGGYYYVVTATDVHGNESLPSNEVSLTGSTDVDGTPAITALALRPNFPNPFSTRTELTIGVPEAGQASMELFDVSGRRVLHRELGRLDRGWKTVALDAVDVGGRPLPSGAYFCRVRLRGQTATIKTIIAR